MKSASRPATSRPLLLFCLVEFVVNKKKKAKQQTQVNQSDYIEIKSIKGKTRGSDAAEGVSCGARPRRKYIKNDHFSFSKLPSFRTKAFCPVSRIMRCCMLPPQHKRCYTVTQSLRPVCHASMLLARLKSTLEIALDRAYCIHFRVRGTEWTRVLEHLSHAEHTQKA